VSGRNLELLQEARRLADLAQAANITARLIGGTAILHHCPALLSQGGSREIADIDLVIPRGQGRALGRLLVSEGYTPEVRFNALHGQRRLLFYGPLCQVDLLVGNFEMCHTIELDGRLRLDYPTLTATDLLLTKLQVVELNEKDAEDSVRILAEHDLSDEEGDLINISYIKSLISRDWGLWRTVDGTLRQISGASSDAAVIEKANSIRTAMRDAPKTLRFRARAQVGDRIRWYTIPDEVRQ
jgi:hypothetical protein